MSLSFRIQRMDLTEDYDTRLRKALGYSIMPSRVSRIVTRPLSSEDGYIKVGSSRISIDEAILRGSIRTEVDSLIEEYSNIEVLKMYNLTFSNKVLFHGPSGCGKTLLATALANRLKKPLVVINLARIVDSGLGKTSANIAEAFNQARDIKAVLFFDEFDALGKNRAELNDHGESRRITSAILQMMDSLDEHVLMIAATNHIEFLDAAILRRFSRKIEFFQPNKSEIKTLLTKLASKANLTINEPVRARIAEKLKGKSYAGAEDGFLIALKRFVIGNKGKKLKLIDDSIIDYIHS